ncbi:MAG: DUF86 domain-containing protein [Bacteroidota bacterium]|nr:DUF86 domain-containing protein [Bacteroidota bacterium]
MDKEIKVWLSDIERAISEIYQFLPDQNDFEAFQSDLKTKRAIERNIEIIGEAMNRILKVRPDFPITTARKIIDTRNRIIHGYDDVSDKIFWTIVVEYLSELQNEIEDLHF